MNSWNAYQSVYLEIIGRTPGHDVRCLKFLESLSSAVFTSEADHIGITIRPI